jgi:hypothetical protein
LLVLGTIVPSNIVDNNQVVQFFDFMIYISHVPVAIF